MRVSMLALGWTGLGSEGALLTSVLYRSHETRSSLKWGRGWRSLTPGSLALIPVNPPRESLWKAVRPYHAHGFLLMTRPVFFLTGRGRSQPLLQPRGPQNLSSGLFEETCS